MRENEGEGECLGYKHLGLITVVLEDQMIHSYVDSISQGFFANLENLLQL